MVKVAAEAVLQALARAPGCRKSAAGNAGPSWCRNRLWKDVLLRDYGRKTARQGSRERSPCAALGEAG